MLGHSRDSWRQILTDLFQCMSVAFSCTPQDCAHACKTDFDRLTASTLPGHADDIPMPPRSVLLCFCVLEQVPVACALLPPRPDPRAQVTCREGPAPCALVIGPPQSCAQVICREGPAPCALVIGRPQSCALSLPPRRSCALRPGHRSSTKLRPEPAPKSPRKLRPCSQGRGRPATWS